MSEAKQKLNEGYELLKQTNVAGTTERCANLHTKVAEVQSLLEQLEVKLLEVRVAQVDVFGASRTAKENIKQAEDLFAEALQDIPGAETTKLQSDTAALRRAMGMIGSSCVMMDAVNHDAQNALNPLRAPINESYPKHDTVVCDNVVRAGETYPGLLQNVEAFIERL